MNRLSTNDIYDVLRRRICTAAYPPGTVIYEAKIAEEFSVSRTPIRMVFNRLENDGLMTTQRGIGNLITEVSMESLQDAYKLRIKLAELIGEFGDPSAVGEALERYRDHMRAAAELGSQPNYPGIGNINLGLAETILLILRETALREATERLYLRTTRAWHLAIPHLDWEEEVYFLRSEIEATLRALMLGDLATVGHIRRNYTALAYKRITKHQA